MMEAGLFLLKEEDERKVSGHDPQVNARVHVFRCFQRWCHPDDDRADGHDHDRETLH